MRAREAGVDLAGALDARAAGAGFGSASIAMSTSTPVGAAVVGRCCVNMVCADPIAPALGEAAGKGLGAGTTGTAGATGAGTPRAGDGAKGELSTEPAGAGPSAMRVALGELDGCGLVTPGMGPPVHINVLATRGPEAAAAAGLATGASPPWVKLPPQAGQNCRPA